MQKQFLIQGVAPATTESRTRGLVKEINLLLKIEEVLTPAALGWQVKGIDRASANEFLDTAAPLFTKLRVGREFVRRGGTLDHLEQMMLVVEIANLWHLADPLLEHYE